MMGHLSDYTDSSDTTPEWAHLIEPENFYARLAVVRQELFKDDEFVELYCLDNGRPSLPPALMALVQLLQFHDNTSDDETAERVRFDLRWKYALGVSLHYAGFDDSSLCNFRKRLQKHGRERAAFDKTVLIGRATGLLPPNAAELIDSAPLRGAGAVKDSYQLIRNAVRKLLEAMGYKNPQRRKHLTPALQPYLTERGKPQIDWDDPAARQALLKQLVDDARASLQLSQGFAVSTPPNGPADETVPGWVAVLTKIVGDDVVTDDRGQPQLRQGVAPDRIISATDPEMRHGRKSAARRFNGYKLSVAEADASELIANVDILAGNAADGADIKALVDEQAEPYDLTPERVTGDHAYGTGDNHAAFAEAQIDLVAPVSDPRSAELFSKSAFQIDLEKGEVTCPAEHTTQSYTWVKDDRGRRVKRFDFGRTRCQDCPLRTRCTTATKTGRTVTLHHHESHLQRMRERQRTEEFKTLYRRRPRIERKLAELLYHGLRRARYVGRAKTKFQALWTAAAVNCKRLFKLLVDAPACLLEVLKQISRRQVAAASARIQARVAIN